MYVQNKNVEVEDKKIKPEENFLCFISETEICRFASEGGRLEGLW